MFTRTDCVKRHLRTWPKYGPVWRSRTRPWSWPTSLEPSWTRWSPIQHTPGPVRGTCKLPNRWKPYPKPRRVFPHKDWHQGKVSQNMMRLSKEQTTSYQNKDLAYIHVTRQLGGYVGPEEANTKRGHVPINTAPAKLNWRDPGLRF